ncbi:hypothetical protein [Pedobacter nutrimenti]|jgi:hypothetical protein|uniref:Uncharacterized protein n=1 Tax=Pedobacter nutrimenti TaxID=1241337 RepID=A0A318U846_9SPHI|nr:hypothetical protein [Pedobacter nutrimenti]PYF70033.1 hypothetical protein B0O44_109124 [Pedobacter nutrimenti]
MLKEEQIKMIADTLLPGFLPKEPVESEISFHFTVPPNQTFKVWYQKKGQAWIFQKYQIITAQEL